MGNRAPTIWVDGQPGPYRGPLGWLGGGVAFFTARFLGAGEGFGMLCVLVVVTGGALV